MEEKQEYFESLIYREIEALREETSDERILEVIDRVLTTDPKRRSFCVEERLNLRRELFHSLRGYGILTELMEDGSVTEIMVNNDGSIYFEREGRLIPYEERFSDPKKLEDLIQKMVSYSNRKINRSSPIVDARLPDGTRVNAVTVPIAVSGPVLTLRKFPKLTFTMERLLENGTLDPERAALLQAYVSSRKNILVFGGTGSGKTTLLNVLGNLIDPAERLVIIEDSAELQIPACPDQIRMEARKEEEELRSVTIRDMIRTSLRMRPDRIIVGEVRGAEVLDMLDSMNTGHEGSLSSAHGNSPFEMLMRLELMALKESAIPLPAMKALIASTIDVLVEMRRLKDGRRVLYGIYEVAGLKEGEYQLIKQYHFPDEDGGRSSAL
ncbi:MAG: CpaF family protein [Lachnospiraceae bacterium]|nr:CpaF family protein [Lachnospiraceae bacterium]